MIYIGVIFAVLLLAGFITTIELMRRVNEKEEQKNERNRTSDY